MNPLQPIRTLTHAVVMPLRAIFVVGLCALINAMTSPGHWWVKWVALGMGIATIVAFARAAKTLLVLGLVFFGGRWLVRRYGQQARDRFDAWVAATQPQAAQVVAALRRAA